MKRKLAMGLLVGAIALAAAGCGGKTGTDAGTTQAPAGAAGGESATPESKAAAASGEKRVVTIWYDGTEEESVKRLEPEFEALHPVCSMRALPAAFPS